MKLESRWLDWHPSTEKLEKIADTELTKLTKPGSVGFDGATPAENPTTAPLVDRSMAAFDPEEWSIEFHAWASTQCALRDGCSGSVGSLFVHFAEWCVRSGSVPCNRQTFEWLLRDQGFRLADGLVAGLILAADEAHRQSESQSRDSFIMFSVSKAR